MNTCVHKKAKGRPAVHYSNGNGGTDTQSFPTDLFVIKDESNGRLVIDPEISANAEHLETKALSPDPTLSFGDHFQ